MYQCLDCDHIFIKPYFGVEYLNADLPPVKFSGCPQCRGEYVSLSPTEETETEDDNGTILSKPL